MKGYILGISCGYHDSAAALIKDGKVLGAVEEERFTGIKHDSSFPTNTINWLYEKFRITGNDISVVCFYDNPKLKLDRIKKSTTRGPLKEYFNRNDIVKRNKNKFDVFHQQMIDITHKDVIVDYGDHHLSHVSYSYYTSPFDKSAILTVDGVGEWDTTTMYYGEGTKITKIHSVKFPHSLGMLYSSFTAFLGFKPNEGEYKVMGLAPYGDYNKFLPKFSKIISPTEDGGFEVNMKLFTYDWSDKHMFNEKLSSILGIPNRLPEDELTQDHKDLAATLQYVYEKYFFRLLDKLYVLKSTNNICLGGGSAYNGTANGKILEKTNYKKLWIPPAPSDAGSAIGCALDYHYRTSEIRVLNNNPFLGPGYSK